ncbi:L,D-transpeptidase family protein [Bdellovibrio bacteriovorus]|uniref:L,D-transpeptidase family protein n=1 Tax=Bdellovibrio bacteriovorus TaxID=959 RepID=UPI0035A6606B
MIILRLILFSILFTFLSRIGTAKTSAASSTPAQNSYIDIIDVYSTKDIRNALLQLWNHGLKPTYYWTPSMEEIYKSNSNSPTLRELAKEKLFQAINNVANGSVNPEELTPDIKFKKKQFVSVGIFESLVASTNQRPELLIEQMAPQNILYKSVQSGVKTLYNSCKTGSFKPIKPSNKILKLGSRDSSVSAIKMRLKVLKYNISSDNNIIDSDFVTAINNIKWTLREPPDGTIKPKDTLWKYFAISCTDRLRQLQADLEKVRWLPQRLEDRFIFLNLALNYLALYDSPNNYMMSFRTINGRSERRTPSMHDHLYQVVLNPAWIVPPTIFIEDKVEEIKKLRKDQIKAYFESKYFEVWNLDLTETIPPESIDWKSITPDSDRTFYIRQKPHYMNTLGVTKFELSNPEFIYLHDTNQRELFVEPNRLLSSGCIRVERPIELAEYLLKGTEWNLSSIQNTVAKPLDPPGKPTKIMLKNPMPIYMIFLTSQTSGNGTVYFTHDDYSQNSLILSKIAAAF